MIVENKCPFIEFTCYLNFHKKMGRWQVCLINNQTKNRKTILYSKFKMSIKEGRILNKEEEVDHKDNDKSNDDIDNLQIVTRLKNREKHFNTLSRNIINLICPYCHITFSREKRHTHLKMKNNSQKHTFCCRKHAAIFQFHGPLELV